MNDGITSGQALDGLAEVGQVGQQRRRSRLSRRHDVGREHVVFVLEQIADNRPSGLSACAGDDDLCHR